MTGLVLQRRRSAWDIALGVLLVIAGIVILGHTVVATVISVLLLGWIVLFSGIVALVAALFRVGKGGFWSTALSGGLLAVLGVVFLRNPVGTAVTLTLVAGALFLATGVARIVASFQHGSERWPLLFGGVVSSALGLIVLFNLMEATLTLLGVLLGVQALLDGIVLLLIGRVTEVQRT